MTGILLVAALTGCKASLPAGSPTHSPSPLGTPPASPVAAPRPTGFAPRFDGLYAGKAASDTREFVRFFADGTVYQAGTVPQATPDDVRRWLRPGDPHTVHSGPWRYDGDGGFTSATPEGTVIFTIKNFRGDSFDLHSVSKINGYVGTTHMTFSPDPAP
jgi:hypothetical protein